jgi:hypothetical protein
MESAWVVLALLACPLGMAAMGGTVWLAAKLRRDESSTTPSPQLDDVRQPRENAPTT